MKASLFVSQLNTAIEQCKSIADPLILDKMKITPKKHKTMYRDELSSLVNNYAVEDVEIGDIVFQDSFDVTPNFLIFARYDMDLLAIDRVQGQVVLLDHDNENFVMSRCCSSGNAFIKLLNEYSTHILRRLCHIQGKTDMIPIFEIAGGDEFKSFVSYWFDVDG